MLTTRVSAVHRLVCKHVERAEAFAASVRFLFEVAVFVGSEDGLWRVVEETAVVIVDKLAYRRLVSKHDGVCKRDTSVFGDITAPVHVADTVGKCDFCVVRIDRGDKPACMELCPGRARYWATWTTRSPRSAASWKAAR